MKHARILLILPAVLWAMLAFGQSSPTTMNAGPEPQASDSAPVADTEPTTASATEGAPVAAATTGLVTTGPATAPTTASGPTTARATATGPTAVAASGASSRPSELATRPAEGPATRPAAGPTVQPSPSPIAIPVVPKGPAWEEYAILTSRNIFSRDRGRRVGPPRMEFAPAAPPAPPGNFIVLTGVMLQSDLELAFFENARTGETTMVGAGKPFAGGTVVSVSLDQVEYRDARGTRKIAIGDNLAGVATPVYLAAAMLAPAPAGASSQPTTGATTGPATQPGGPTPLPPGSSLEERMRLRRLQENR